jgi:EAL domain-containing protein (putative c-di-GMP-specific phosphodiesterase class I)
VHSHFLWFQPIVCARTGLPLCAEALARTYDGDGDIVSAGTLFSRDDLSDVNRLKLDRHTLRQIGFDMRTWVDPQFAPRLSINISTQTITQHAELVLAWLAEEGLRAEAVTIEMTETAPIKDIGAIAQAVELFRMAGVQIAIDDFGCGSSTLQLLHRVHVDHLKIDQHFVRSVTDSRRSRRFITAIVDLAHDLGTRVVAEGVESEEHWKWLSEAGCDAVQGHAIASPMPAHELLAWRPLLAWSSSFSNKGNEK